MIACVFFQGPEDEGGLKDNTWNPTLVGRCSLDVSMFEVLTSPVLFILCTTVSRKLDEQCPTWCEAFPAIKLKYLNHCFRVRNSDLHMAEYA